MKEVNILDCTIIYISFMTKKLLSNLNFFLKSRWTLRPPKEKDILIYDGITNPFTKYFSSKFINILYVRKE